MASPKRYQGRQQRGEHLIQVSRLRGELRTYPGAGAGLFPTESGQYGRSLAMDIRILCIWHRW